METEKIKELLKEKEVEFQCGKRKIETEDQGSPAKLKKTDLPLKELQPNRKAALPAPQAKQLEFGKGRQQFGKENFATQVLPDSSSQSSPETEGDSYNDNDSDPHMDDEDRMHPKNHVICPSSQSEEEGLPDSDTDHGAVEEKLKLDEMKRLLQEKEAALQACRKKREEEEEQFFVKLKEKDARLSEWPKTNSANADFEKQLAIVEERCHILHCRGKEKNAKLKEQKLKLESQTIELNTLKQKVAAVEAKRAGLARRGTAKNTMILQQKERLEYLESFVEHMQTRTQPQRRGIDP